MTSGNYCGWLIWHGENFRSIANCGFPRRGDHVGKVSGWHQSPDRARTQRQAECKPSDNRRCARRARSLGLIYRRPRLGTQVASRFPMKSHVEEGSVLHDWARYGVEYFFEVLRKDYVPLPREAGERIQRETRKWLKLSGRRVRPRSNRPICAVDVYVHPDYVAIEPDVPRRPPRIFSLIEARYGLLVAAVEQELRAFQSEVGRPSISASSPAAVRLKSCAGTVGRGTS